VLAGGGFLPARRDPSDIRSADPRFCRPLVGEAAQRQGMYIHILIHAHRYVYMYVRLCIDSTYNFFVLINLYAVFF
jgi:hypothetical protein